MARIFLLLAIALGFSLNCYSQKINLINSGKVLEDGVAAYDSGDYDNAIKTFLTVSARDTNYVRVLNELARAYNGAKQFDKVFEICDKALKEPSEFRASFLRSKAIALDKSGEYNKAVALFEKSVDEYPADHVLLFYLGITHYNNKVYDKARECFFRALSINPYHGPSHLNLGNLSIMEGKKAHAMFSYGMYLLLNRNDNQRLVLIDKFVTNQVSDEGSLPSISTNSFEKLDQVVRAKIAMDKNFKTKVPVDAGVVKQYELLFDQLDLQNLEIKDPWADYYVSIYKTIRDQKSIEPFIYEILASSANETVKKWRKKNEKVLDNFYTLARAQLETKRVKPILPASLGIDKNTSGWYNDDKQLVAIGNQESEEKRIGRWIFFHTSAEKSAEGSYDASGKKVGVWKYYYRNGKISKEENYNTGEFKSYFESGKLRQRYTVKNEKVEGDVELYYPCGVVKEKLGYKNDQQEGPGTIFYTSGQVHKKYQHVAGKLEGEFITYFEDGKIQSKYTYKAGKLDGPHVENFSNGKISSVGQYTNDFLDGTWKYYYSNGKLNRTGSYKNGIGVGEWNFFNERGDQTEKRIFNDEGKLNGENTFYHNNKLYNVDTYKNGMLLKVAYYDQEKNKIGEFGKPDGNFAIKSYYATGHLNSEGSVKKGQLQGKWKYYYRHGKLLSEFLYEDGELQGEAREYYASGAVKSILNYKDGELDGYYQEFYDHGPVKTEGWYQDGKRQQQWLSYSTTGKIIADNFYLNGELYKTSYDYNVDGKLDIEVDYDETGLVSDMRSYNSKSKMNTVVTEKGPRRIYETMYGNKKPQSRFEQLCGEYDGMVSKWYSDGKPFYNFAIRKNKREGRYVSYDVTNVLKTEGNYINGQAEGVWKGYYENGKPEYVGYYFNDSSDSLWTYYFPDGKISSTAQFFRDKRHGLTKFFSPDGNPAIEKLYDKGDLISYREMQASGSWGEWKKFSGDAAIVAFYPSGTKSYEEQYVGGLLKGVKRLNFANGKPFSEVTYVNGDYHGPFSFYYVNGKPRKKGNYNYDEFHGKLEYFNEDGSLLKTEEYLEGSLTGKVVVYSKGVKTKEYNFWGGLADE